MVSWAKRGINLKNFSRIQTKAKSFLSRVMKSGAETTITYKLFKSSTFDDETGMNVDVYSEYEIPAVRVDASLQAQLASTILAGVAFSSGEIIYLIQDSEMPRSDPYSPNILKDYILDGDIERQIKNAVPIFDILVKVQV